MRLLALLALLLALDALHIFMLAAGSLVTGCCLAFLGPARQALAADLPKALGLEAEAKPFVPHLTVARVPSRAGRKDRRQIGSILEGIRGCETSSSELANTVSLFQSRLDSSGAKYIRLHSADLTQKKDP